MSDLQTNISLAMTFTLFGGLLIGFACGKIYVRYKQDEEIDRLRQSYVKNLTQIAALVTLCERHGLKDEAVEAIKAAALAEERKT